jgi:transposase-like protein
VITVSCPQRAEASLQAGTMTCPHCRGRLRPYGHGRTRTVRGLGADTLRVTPRRARCADCRATQILLPGALTCRRADSTEVIGHALAAKAAGAGFRTIATRLGRPPSTVRRWLRRAPERHAQWLYQRAVERCVQIDRELLVHPAPQPTLLGHALNLLAGAALRYRERLGYTDPPWALIGCFSHGYLLAPPLIT